MVGRGGVRLGVDEVVESSRDASVVVMAYGVADDFATEVSRGLPAVVVISTPDDVVVVKSGPEIEVLAVEPGIQDGQRVVRLKKWMARHAGELVGEGEADLGSMVVGWLGRDVDVRALFDGDGEGLAQGMNVEEGSGSDSDPGVNFPHAAREDGPGVKPGMVTASAEPVMVTADNSDAERDVSVALAATLEKGVLLGSLREVPSFGSDVVVRSMRGPVSAGEIWAEKIAGLPKNNPMLGGWLKTEKGSFYLSTDSERKGDMEAAKGWVAFNAFDQKIAELDLHKVLRLVSLHTDALAGGAIGRGGKWLSPKKVAKQVSGLLGGPGSPVVGADVTWEVVDVSELDPTSPEWGERVNEKPVAVSGAAKAGVLLMCASGYHFNNDPSTAEHIARYGLPMLVTDGIVGQTKEEVVVTKLDMEELILQNVSVPEKQDSRIPLTEAWYLLHNGKKYLLGRYFTAALYRMLCIVYGVEVASSYKYDAKAFAWPELPESVAWISTRSLRRPAQP